MNDSISYHDISIVPFPFLSRFLLSKNKQNKNRHNLDNVFYDIFFSKCFDMLGDKSCIRDKSNDNESVAVLNIYIYSFNCAQIQRVWVPPSLAGQVLTAERQVSFKDRVCFPLRQEHQANVSSTAE